MKTYRWRKWGGVLFLLLMLVVGYSAIPFKGNELFPFYSWSMFSLVPGVKVGYTVFIRELNGQTYSPAVEFCHADGLPIQVHSVVVYRNIQNLGMAFDSGNFKEFEELRDYFEKNYLPPLTRYALYRTKYDPLQQWRTGERQLTLLQQR